MSVFSRYFRPRGSGFLAEFPVQALIAGLLFSFVSITLTQGLFAAALAVWAAKVIARRERLAVPRFALPLALYAAWSLVATATSVNPALSLRVDADLAIFFLVPLVYGAFARTSQVEWAGRAVLVSAAASIALCFYQFAASAPGTRVRGFVGHYMTQAGLLTLFCALALAAAALLRKRERWAWAAGFVAACGALVLTLTRSAWIGLAVVALVVLLATKPKWVLVLPVAAALAFAAAPRPVKQRALSIVDPNAYSNLTRGEYLRAGLRMIRSRPLFGFGPDTADLEFQNPKYGLSEEARRNVHLHSNLTQIAAERGLPALAFWLAFLVWAAADLMRARARGGPTTRIAATAALAALSALFVAGLFEYNFGDSEIAMLFLVIVTAPFASLRLDAAKAAGAAGEAR